MLRRCGGHPLDLVRLERRQHLLGEAAELLQEHVLRHGAKAHHQQQGIGAVALGVADQLVGDVLGVAEGEQPVVDPPAAERFSSRM